MHSQLVVLEAAAAASTNTATTTTTIGDRIFGGKEGTADPLNQINELAAVDDRRTMTKTTTTTTMMTVVVEEKEEESAIENPMLTAGKRTLSSALRSYQYVTSGFYKFLARFSGECDYYL